MSQPRQLAFAAILLFGGACANPAAVGNKKAQELLRDYPDHVVKVEDPYRPLTFVWMGDPNLRPVLFVHGSPGSWQGWAHLLLDRKLRERFQVIAVDRPGYGGSGRGISEPSVEVQAKTVMKALEINRSGLPAILVGHSYGGPVVAQAAMSYPGRVGGVVFVSSSVDPLLEKTKWFQYPATWWPIRSLIPDDLRVCNEEIFGLKSELIRMSSHWPSMGAKVVMIQGSEDSLVPQGNLDFLKAHIAQEHVIKIDRVEGLNHFVPWKRPDLILEGIMELDSALPK